MEELRVVTFTDITLEPNDWKVQVAGNGVIEYRAVGGSSSITIKRDGTTVYDQDLKNGQMLYFAGNVVHLPEMPLPD
jgi:hypothetical protein